MKKRNKKKKKRQALCQMKSPFNSSVDEKDVVE